MYLATYKEAASILEEQVAVKLVKVNASLSEREDFLGEAELILTLGNAPGLLKASMLQVSYLNIANYHIIQVYGVCVSRKPWLLITEFMQYKDLGYVLQQALRIKAPLRMNELLYLAKQIAQSLIFLEQVRVFLI